MSFNFLFFIGFLLLAYQTVQISSRVELTNLKCDAIDWKYTAFEYCRIKSINRTYKYISIKANLLQIPVNDIQVKVVLFKRFNDFKPFLYNVTIDGCKFLASRKRNLLFNIFYSFFSQQTNANHTCPFDHDIIVDKVTVDFINNQITNVLPLPSGDYIVLTSWYTYGVHRGDVRIYGTVS